MQGRVNKIIGGRKAVFEIEVAMDTDLKTVEQLVEIITREVLVAMAEQKQRAGHSGWPAVQAATAPKGCA